MTALDGCFSTSGLGAEWYKKACIPTHAFTHSIHTGSYGGTVFPRGDIVH